MFNRGIIGGAPGVEAVHTDDAISTADNVSYTFSSMSIGDASSNRMVVVAGIVGTTSIVPAPAGVTVTIGGSSATVVNSIGMFNTAFIAYLKVPTGTTANVVVTRVSAATQSQCGISVYALSTTTSSADDTTTSDGSSGSLSGPLTVAKGGAVICSFMYSGTGAVSVAWSGTEAFQTSINATSESERRLMGHIDVEENSTSDLSFACPANPAAFSAASFIY